MTNYHVRKATRTEFVLWLLAFASAGIVSGWLGFSALEPALRDSAAGVSVVEFRLSRLIGLPLSLTFLALLLFVIASKPKLTRCPARRSGGPSWEKLALYTVMACVMLTIIALPLGRIVMSNVMTARGYRECDPSSEYRRPPVRWVRTRLPCPA